MQAHTHSLSPSSSRFLYASVVQRLNPFPCSFLSCLSLSLAACLCGHNRIKQPRGVRLPATAASRSPGSRRSGRRRWWRRISFRFLRTLDSRRTRRWRRRRWRRSWWSPWSDWSPLPLARGTGIRGSRIRRITRRLRHGRMAAADPDLSGRPALRRHTRRRRRAT